MTETENHKPPQYRTILAAYAVQWIALLSSCMTSAAGAVASIVLLAGGTWYCSFVRKRSEPDSLAANHMTFLIRTVALGSSFALLTVGIASVYMLKAQDVTPLTDCLQQILDAGNQPDYAILEPCFEKYMDVNHHMIVVSSVIGILPVLVYFLYRFTVGLMRAIKGHRLGNPLRWF